MFSPGQFDLAGSKAGNADEPKFSRKIHFPIYQNFSDGFQARIGTILWLWGFL
jgi:hypothetical protein